MRKFLAPAMSAALAVSCVGSPKRGPDSVDGASRWTNPPAEGTFWSEMQSAKDGINKDYQIDSAYKLGVFFKWMRANPVGAFRDLRAKAPVLSFSDSTTKKVMGAPVVIVSSAADVAEILSSPNFSAEPETRPGQVSPRVRSAENDSPELSSFDAVLAELDRPVRERVRSVVSQTFEDQIYVGTDRDGRRFARIELVGQLGRRVPALINENVFGIFGLEQREVSELSRALEDELLFNQVKDPKIAESGKKAGEAVRVFTETYLRGGAPDGSVLERLRRRSKNANPIEMQKIVASLVGGVEITQTAVAHAIDQLFEHGQVEAAYAAARSGNDAQLKKYFDEALRFNPVRPYAVRVAKVETRLSSGARIPPGALVIVGTHSAMFDAASVAHPLIFRAERAETFPLAYRFAGTSQLRDEVGAIEAFEIFKILVSKPGLRRVEGTYGLVDHRRIFTSNLLKETYRYSFPEQFSVEFDMPAGSARARKEIPNREYAYEEYLKDYDRASFRACLGDLAEIVKSGEDRYREVPRGTWGKLGAIQRSFEVTKLNRTRENKHWLYCRLPVQFRGCMGAAKVNILRPEEQAKHEAAYRQCAGPLNETQKAFYDQVFFGKPLNVSVLRESADTGGPDYEFESLLPFYDRYRARESMMNPGGFNIPPAEMLFYVRLNIDFRMCVGAPALKHKYSGGLVGLPKEAVYPKCRDGVWNPQTHQREGALTVLEQYLYEKIMLGSELTYEQVRERERHR